MQSSENQLSIMHALTTVFFQEGFNREQGTHGLAYWRVDEEDIPKSTHFRQCRIVIDGIQDHFAINTYKDQNGRWYIRLVEFVYHDELDDEDADCDAKTLLLIPVNTKRLCWEEFTKCVRLIEEVFHYV